MNTRLILLIGIILITCRVDFAQNSDSFVNTTKKVLSAIVKIFAETDSTYVSDMTAEIQKDSSNKLYSTGTGFFVSKDGYILTANHIIRIATGEIFILENKPKFLL